MSIIISLRWNESILGTRWIKRSVTKSDLWVYSCERVDFVLFSVSLVYSFERGVSSFIIQHHIYNPIVSLTTKILIVRILRIIWTLTIIWVKIPIQNCLSCDFRERVWISSTLISYIIFLALQIHYNCYFYINRTQGMVLYEMQRLLWEKSKAYKMWLVGLDNHAVLWYTVCMRLNKWLYRAVNLAAGFRCHGSSRPESLTTCE